MKTKLFDQKRVLVTGGAAGIGYEIARKYFENGAHVIIADIQPAIRDFEFQYIYADVSSPNSISNLFAEIGKNIGSLDILINNAGVSIFTPFEETNIDIWDKVINTNLRSVFLCSQAALPLMIRNNGGNIVNIASTRALMSEENTEAYAASKGGIVAITHALSVTLSKHRVQVNAISPGWIETKNYGGLKFKDHEQHPSRRVGKPEDIANACIYLTSPNNEFINGANLVIDGGMTKKLSYEE